YSACQVSSPLARCFALFTSGVTCIPILFARPHLVTLIALTLTLLLFRCRRNLPIWLPYAVLPPLFALWANCHGGVVLGVLPFLAEGLDGLVDAWREEPGAWRHL